MVKAKRSTRSRLVRFAMVVSMGGTMFQFSGCSADVRNTIVSGLESTASTLATTLISSFFQGLADDSGGSSGFTTT